jgi:hypothetical protein
LQRGATPSGIRLVDSAIQTTMAMKHY